jgi:hypothetical protein
MFKFDNANSFYVFLPSNGDTKGIFPQNSTTNYSIPLQSPIELEPEQWEVGVSEIVVPNYLYNIFPPNNKIGVRGFSKYAEHSKTGVLRQYTVYLQPGRYSAKQFVKGFNQMLEHCKIRYLVKKIAPTQQELAGGEQEDADKTGGGDSRPEVAATASSGLTIITMAGPPDESYSIRKGNLDYTSETGGKPVKMSRQASSVVAASGPQSTSWTLYDRDTGQDITEEWFQNRSTQSQDEELTQKDIDDPLPKNVEINIGEDEVVGDWIKAIEMAGKTRAEEKKILADLEKKIKAAEGTLEHRLDRIKSFLVYNEERKTFGFVLKSLENITISSAVLREMMGFKKGVLGAVNRKKGEKIVELPRPANLDMYLEKLYVYTNIVQESLIGDMLARVIRIVHADESPERNDIYRLYNPPQYFPVVSRVIHHLDIRITDSLGEDIVTQSGDVLVVLHFKRRQINDL